jgi:hypothetical protein
MVESGEIPPNVTDLLLDSNHITDPTPLARLPNLTSLSLSNNAFDWSNFDWSNFDWEDFESGIGIDPFSLNLTPLSGLTNLEHLDLRHSISDYTQLAGLTNLRGLSLTLPSQSELVQLSGLTNLESLSLQGEINDLTPLAGLTNLTRLG